jgi:death on curing protein
MSDEPQWLDVALVLDFHAEQLALFGGPEGVRDEGLLESALARPINKFGYRESDMAALAGAYGFGIAKNHPFIDGNKRTALAAMIVFLGLNQLDVEASPQELSVVVLSLAAGEISEDLLAHWLREHLQPLDAPSIQP